MAGLSLGGLVVGSGVATAGSASGSRGKQQLDVEDGRLVVDRDAMSAEAFKEEMMVAAVEDFNRAIEAGHMSLVEEDGKSVLEVHSSAAEMVEGDL